jgi:hypothetical protein
MLSLRGTILAANGNGYESVTNGDDNFLVLTSSSGFTVLQCRIDTANSQFLCEAKLVPITSSRMGYSIW